MPDDAATAPQFTPRTIVININGWNDFSITEGNRSVDRLCWDEMLGSIAEITHHELGKTRYPMRTAEEHAEDKRQREERMAKIQPFSTGEQHAE